MTMIIRKNVFLFDFQILGTFKYHMTPQGGRGVCSNRQSAVIWGRRDLSKSSYNFYSGWKSSIYSSCNTIYGTICGGAVIWEKASNIAQKPLYDIWTFLFEN